MNIRALSYTEPWATLMACGRKTFETRSWGTSYRGPIVIHSAKNFPEDCRRLCHEEPFLSALSGHAFHVGHVIAIGRLFACVRIHRVPVVGERKVLMSGIEITFTEDELAFGNYAVGRYVWVHEKVTPIRPVPVRGRLGLWTWDAPAEVVPRILALQALPLIHER